MKRIVVTSKTGRYSDEGIPLGQILCRPEEVKEVIERHNLKDPILHDVEFLEGIWEKNDTSSR